jgi:hypothetical protein
LAANSGFSGFAMVEGEMGCLKNAPNMPLRPYPIKSQRTLINCGTLIGNRIIENLENTITDR